MRYFYFLYRLRQGDPLSTFLFTVVGNAFSYLFEIGRKGRLVKGFEIGCHPFEELHLQYEEDRILMLQGGSNGITNAKK